jgi:hypothetical protein
MLRGDLERTVRYIDWTYHSFDGLKIIMMRNGYSVLRAFLFEVAK